MFLILIGLPYCNTVAISMERPRVVNEIGDLIRIILICMLKLVRITSTYGCDLHTKTWTAVNITLIIGVLTGANESHHLSCSVSGSHQNAI